MNTGSGKTEATNQLNHSFPQRWEKPKSFHP